jgi:hypothetical protein
MSNKAYYNNLDLFYHFFNLFNSYKLRTTYVYYLLIFLLLSFKLMLKFFLSASHKPIRSSLFFFIYKTRSLAIKYKYFNKQIDINNRLYTIIIQAENLPHSKFLLLNPSDDTHNGKF